MLNPCLAPWQQPEQPEPAFTWASTLDSGEEAAGDGAEATLLRMRKELREVRYEVAGLRLQAGITRAEFARTLDQLGAVQAEVMAIMDGDEPLANLLAKRRPAWGVSSTLEEICKEMTAVSKAGGEPVPEGLLLDLSWRFVELSSVEGKDASW